MSDRDTSELIWQIVKHNIPYQCTYAVVKTVDKEKHLCDCEILENDTPLPEVQLTAVAEMQESYVVIYPKIGSTVLVSIINNNKTDAYVIGVSEWESIKIVNKDTDIEINKDELILVNDTTKIEVNKNKAEITVDSAKVKVDKSGEITFNDGSKGGSIIWSKLKADLQKITQYLTAFDTVLQTPITEPGNGSPSAFQASLKISLSGKTMPTLTDADIVNAKVKHGV